MSQRADAAVLQPQASSAPLREWAFAFGFARPAKANAHVCTCRLKPLRVSTRRVYLHAPSLHAAVLDPQSELAPFQERALVTSAFRSQRTSTRSVHPHADQNQWAHPHAACIHTPRFLIRRRASLHLSAGALLGNSSAMANTAKIEEGGPRCTCQAV